MGAETRVTAMRLPNRMQVMMGSRTSRFLFALVAWLGASSQTIAAHGNVVYVNHAAAGANTGSSWSDAFISLDDALLAAAAGDELWVAQGSYEPATYLGFEVRKAVLIQGGFQGTETRRDQSDPRAYPTVFERTPGSLLDLTWVEHADAFPARLSGLHFRGSTRDGIGVWAVAGSLDLHGCLFENLASGAYCANGARNPLAMRLRVTDCEFLGNRSPISVVDLSVELTDCTFQDNSGAVRFLLVRSAGRSLSVLRCHFLDNEVNLTAVAGALYVDHVTPQPARLEVRDSVFARNRGPVGALYLNITGKFTIANCRFEDNVSEDGIGGGAIRLRGDGHLLVQDSRFVGNRFKLGSFGILGGGAILVEGLDFGESGLALNRCHFSGNEAKQGAGGALNFRGWRLVVANSAFVGNHAEQGAGGVECASDLSDRSWFMNNTVVNNTTTYGTAGLQYFRQRADHGMQVVNNVFYGNREELNWASLRETQLSDGMSERYCCIEGDAGTGTNTGADPLFVDWQAGNFRLSASSPLIDFGDPASASYLPPLMDLDFGGEARWNGARFDVGADEFH